MFGPPRISTTELIRELDHALGPRLKSAVLYGSVVAGDYDRDSSDVNLLLVVSPLGLAELETMSPLTRRWRSDRQRAPQVFTPEQVARSLDAFAIEWHDMHQTRRVLHGADPFETLSIPIEPLRLQIERELNACVLALREGFLKSGGDWRRLLRLMTQSVVPLIVQCRAALRLFPDGGMVPAMKVDALHVLASKLNLDLEPIARVFRIRQRESKPPDDMVGLFGEYLRAAERLLDGVDRAVLHEQVGASST